MKFADCLFGAKTWAPIETISAPEPPTPRSLRRKASTRGANPFAAKFSRRNRRRKRNGNFACEKKISLGKKNVSLRSSQALDII
jgi:hypothetical protein